MTLIRARTRLVWARIRVVCVVPVRAIFVISKRGPLYCRENVTKGPFIVTQLNSTRRRVKLCHYKRALTHTHTHTHNVGRCTELEECSLIIEQRKKNSQDNTQKQDINTRLRLIATRRDRTMTELLIKGTFLYIYWRKDEIWVYW